MKIEFIGLPGSGKSTLKNCLIKRRKIKRYKILMPSIYGLYNSKYNLRIKKLLNLFNNNINYLDIIKNKEIKKEFIYCISNNIDELHHCNDIVLKWYKIINLFKKHLIIDKHYKSNDHILLLDEWYAHSIFKVIPRRYFQLNNSVRSIIEIYVQFMPKSDIYFYIDIQPDEGLNRQLRSNERLPSNILRQNNKSDWLKIMQYVRDILEIEKSLLIKEGCSVIDIDGSNSIEYNNQLIIKNIKNAIHNNGFINL